MKCEFEDQETFLAKPIVTSEWRERYDMVGPTVAGASLLLDEIDGLRDFVEELETEMKNCGSHGI